MKILTFIATIFQYYILWVLFKHAWQIFYAKRTCDHAFGSPGQALVKSIQSLETRRRIHPDRFSGSPGNQLKAKSVFGLIVFSLGAWNSSSPIMLLGFALIVVSFTYHARSSRPPHVIYLSVTSHDSIQRFSDVSESCWPARACTLIKVQHDSIPFSWKGGKAETSVRINSLRTRVDEDWRESVTFLIQNCPVVIIDPIADSTHLQEEIKMVIDAGADSRCIICKQQHSEPFESLASQLPAAKTMSYQSMLEFLRSLPRNSLIANSPHVFGETRAASNT